MKWILNIWITLVSLWLRWSRQQTITPSQCLYVIEVNLFLIENNRQRSFKCTIGFHNIIIMVFDKFLPHKDVGHWLIRLNLYCLKSKFVSKVINTRKMFSQGNNLKTEHVFEWFNNSTSFIRTGGNIANCYRYENYYFLITQFFLFLVLIK